MYKIPWIILAYVCTLPTIAQNKGPHQYHWAILHPIAAIKVQHIYKKNLPIYLDVKNKKLLDTLENGGQLDAFRHAFFMACFAQKIKYHKLEKLSIAHEKDDMYFFKKNKKEFSEIPDSSSINMDLYNNKKGIMYGRKYPHITPQQIKDTIFNLILTQQLKTIK